MAQLIHSQPRDPKAVRILARAPKADNGILEIGRVSSPAGEKTKYGSSVSSGRRGSKNSEISVAVGGAMDAPRVAPSRTRVEEGRRNCGVDPAGGHPVASPGVRRSG